MAVINGREANKNFLFLCQNYDREDRKGVALEGSSRSGKTISSVDFIIWYCLRNTGKTINVIKETYNSFKTTLYDDFNKRLIDFGIASPFERSKEVITFDLLGNKVNFLGADKESKFLGASCDLAYFNEVLDIEKGIFDQTEMRCRDFFWMDYNPKVTEHWVFNSVIKRDDVAFLHSTFKDNPFISKTELNKILSYEPTPENERQGTVDEYKWKVYGLGVRSALEGLVFPNVFWINEFPEDCEEECYGLDFGANDPAALGRVGVKPPVEVGRKPRLYLQKKFYLPIQDNNLYYELLDASLPEDYIVWADSARPDLINDLKMNGFAIYGAYKPRGSVNFGIGLMKRFEIHIVRDTDSRKEQENYKWKEVNGIKLNEPEDKNNHLWDCWRYATYMQFRYYGLVA